MDKDDLRDMDDLTALLMPGNGLEVPPGDMEWAMEMLDTVECGVRLRTSQQLRLRKVMEVARRKERVTRHG